MAKTNLQKKIESTLKTLAKSPEIKNIIAENIDLGAFEGFLQSCFAGFFNLPNSKSSHYVCREKRVRKDSEVNSDWDYIQADLVIIPKGEWDNWKSGKRKRINDYYSGIIEMKLAFIDEWSVGSAKPKWSSKKWANDIKKIETVISSAKERYAILFVAARLDQWGNVFELEEGERVGERLYDRPSEVKKGVEKSIKSCAKNVLRKAIVPIKILHVRQYELDYEDGYNPHMALYAYVVKV